MRDMYLRFIAAVSIAALAISGCVRGGSERSSDGAKFAGAQSRYYVDESGEKLLGLLRRSADSTYFARYRATAANNGATESTLEVWRKPPHLRRDSLIVEGKASRRVAIIKSPSGLLNCEQVDSAPWNCSTINATASEVEIESLVSLVEEEIKNKRVTERATKINGRNTLCFSVEDESASEQSICVGSDDGVPIRVTLGDQKIELIAFNKNVPDEAFTPPDKTA